MKINVTLRDTEILETEFQDDNSCDTNLETGTITQGIIPDYERLNNLPQINGNTLIGDKTSEQLGIRIVGTYDNENLNIGLF